MKIKIKRIKIKSFIISNLFYLFLIQILFYSNYCKAIKLKNNTFNKLRSLSQEIDDVYNYMKSKISSYSYEEIKTDEYIFQLTDSQNEINTLNGINLNRNDLSIIDLVKCGEILKLKNNINNLNLIILKYENLTNLTSEKNVQYEIYNPINKKKLDLSPCNNISINLYIPININNESQILYDDLNKSGYNSFDINDPFYHDICTLYKTKDNTDILLSDRRKDYYIKEGAPQSNCEFLGNIDNIYLKYNCTIDKEGINATKINRFSGESNLANY